MSNYTVNSGKRVAWQNRGREHALKGLDRQAPKGKVERDAYMKGYAIGKRERLREEAGKES